MKQVDAWRATLAGPLLSFIILLFEARRQRRRQHSPTYFLSLCIGGCCLSQSTGVRAHLRHLHGDLIWIIGRGGRKWSEHSTLNLNIFLFSLLLSLIKLHVSLNLNCFFGEPAYVIWFAIFSGNGLYYFGYQGKSDRATRYCHNLAISTFEGAGHSWKDAWITFVKEEKSCIFFFFKSRENKYLFLCNKMFSNSPRDPKPSRHFFLFFFPLKI